jgi:ABC-type Zn uptake system ZnuABC Zn-binding protein ZnuA
VTYHRSWSNFADAFGLDVIGFVEPKPGIPPTPQHTLDVIQAMRQQNVKLILVEPYFDQQLAAFNSKLDAGKQRWLAATAPYKGLKVVTYHRSFPNFAERFGLDVIGYVEPRPGIPPTPQHTLDLIGEMKRQNVKLILVEPYFDLKTPNSIARSTGAQVVVLPPSVGGVKEITDYVALFDYDVNLLVNAIKQSGAK